MSRKIWADVRILTYIYKCRMSWIIIKSFKLNLIQHISYIHAVVSWQYVWKCEIEWETLLREEKNSSCWSMCAESGWQEGKYHFDITASRVIWGIYKEDDGDSIEMCYFLWKRDYLGQWILFFWNLIFCNVYLKFKFFWNNFIFFCIFLSKFFKFLCKINKNSKQINLQ